MRTRIRRLLKPYRLTLYTAIALAVFALILVYVYASRSGKYRWQPLRMPLDIQAGEVAEGRFTAELDEPYEVEFEFEVRLPKKELKRLVMPINTPAALDVNWLVFNRDQIVAQGNCREYLYLRESSGAFVRKMATMILNIKEIKGSVNTVVRGVGQFNCRVGDEYKVRAEVGTTIEALSESDPIFGVRVNRRFAEKYFTGQMLPLAIGGIGMLGLSSLTFCWWALAVILRR